MLLNAGGKSYFFYTLHTVSGLSLDPFIRAAVLFWGQTLGIGVVRPPNAAAVLEGLIYPFRTAVPFWGQTTQTLSGSSPKRD